MTSDLSMVQAAGQVGSEAFDYSTLSDEQLDAQIAQAEQFLSQPQGQGQTSQPQLPAGWNGDPSTLTDEQLDAFLGGPQPEQDFSAGDYAQQVASSLFNGFWEMIPATMDFVGLVGDMIGFNDNADSHGYAEAVRNFGLELVPAVEGLEDSFFASTLPGAIGSTASFFIPGAAASKLAKGASVISRLGKVGVSAKAADLIARFGVPGSLGAMQSGAAQFYEAEASGASEDDSWMAFALGTAVGTTEALPISQILNRINGVTGGALRAALIEGVEELTQEYGQTVASNLIAKNLYDEEREILEGAAEGGAAGFLTGVLFSAVVSASSRKLPRRRDETDAPQPEGTASVQAQVEALGEGRIDAFFLPENSAEPEGLTGDYRIVKDEDGRGTLYLGADAQATFDAFEADGVDPFDELGTVLGYGTEQKPETPTNLLAARDETGRLVRGTLVDSADLEGSAAALAASTRAAGPKGTVDTLTQGEAAEALQERAGERATVTTVSLADAAAITRVLGPDVREVQAPQGTGQAVQKFGQERGRRVAFVEQKSGQPITQSGFINPTTGTLFLDANAGEGAQLWGLLGHEMTHALSDEGGDLATQLNGIAPDVVSAFTEQYAQTYQETFGKELPENLRGEEGVALLTENLGGFLQYAAQNPGALEAIGTADRNLLQRIVDLVVDFLKKAGINLDTRTEKELKSLRDQIASTEFEATADPELVRKLATTVSGALDSTLGQAVPPPVMLIGRPTEGPAVATKAEKASIKEAKRAKIAALREPQSKPAKAPQDQVLPSTKPTGRKLTGKQAKRQRQKAGRLRGQGEQLRAEGAPSAAVEREARIPKITREPGPRAAQSRRTEISAADAAAEAFEAGEDVRFALAPKVDTPAFKRWFGDSKVVDADGNPLVVYHGRHGRDLGSIDEFEGLSFFTDNPEAADQYAGAKRKFGTSRLSGEVAAPSLGPSGSRPGGQVIPVYLSLQNPLLVMLDGGHVGTRRAQALRDARKQDRDGVVFREGEDVPQESDPYGTVTPVFGDVYVAFNPTQIKSAIGNVGTFDPQSPDIRRALRPKETVQVVFGKTGKSFRKNLTAMGNLPAGAFNAKIARDGAANVELKEMQVTIRDFDAAVRKEFGKKPGEEAINRIDAAFKDARKIRSLPKGLQGPVRAMREHVDILSRRMIDVGVIAGQMEARFGRTGGGPARAAEAASQLEGQILENLGFYATRSYRVFDDPKWADKVPVEVRDKAKALLRSEYPGRTESQIEGLIGSLLYEGKAAQSPIALMSRSKLGSKDLSILTKRKVIAPEIRALFGEYKDARVNYARSVMKMGHLIANQQFLTEVKSAGLGTWLLESPEVRNGQEFKLRIAADESSAMAPLNGLYTTPEIEQAFREAVESEQLPEWLRLYMKANSAVKFAKTIGSPMTHVRNTIGNIGFAVANGHWQFWQASTAVKGAATNFALSESLLKKPAEWRAYFKRAIAAGVVHEDARGGEIRDLLRDAARSGPDDFLDNTLAGKVKRGLGLQADIYQAEDDVWKLYAWENEKARYRKAFPDIADARLEELAAKIVRNTYPTYSLVPRFIKKLRRFPLVGNFVSFPWEVMRVTGNTFRQMREELTSDNAELKKIGAQRLVGMTLAATGTSAAAAASRFLLGLSDEDDDDARLFMAPWDRNSDIIWIGGNEDGNRTWINISYTDPYSYLKKPILAFMRGEDVDNAIIEAGTELLSPFFGEEMLAGKLIDVQRNTTDTGGSVYNPEGSWQAIAGEVAEHVGETFKPGAMVSMERIWKGVTGYVEPYGKSYDPSIESLAVATGIRLNALDVPQSLSFRASDYARSLGRATSSLSSVASRRGTVTDAELREAYEEAEISRRRLFGDMERAAKAAIALGVPRDEVSRILRSTLSKDKARAVLRGEYAPYEPSSSFLRSRSRGASKEVVQMYSKRRNLLRKISRETSSE